MENNVLLTTARRKRIEIKYLVIALALAGGMLLLVSTNAFDGLERSVNGILDKAAGMDALGLFLIALPSNMTLVVQVPYILPMFSLTLYSDTVWNAVWLGAVTGVGAGLGEIASYAMARAVLANMGDLEESAAFRWIRKHIERRPGLIPILVWAASATPLPDMVLIVPVSLVGYPWRKMIAPMLAGKVMMNALLCLVFYYVADGAAGLVSADINFDLAAGLVLLSAQVVAYQLEKARHEKGTSATAES